MWLFIYNYLDEFLALNWNGCVTKRRPEGCSVRPICTLELSLITVQKCFTVSPRRIRRMPARRELAACRLYVPVPQKYHERRRYV